MIHAAALCSGDGAMLQSLLDSAFFAEIPDFELSALISTEPGAYSLTRARGAGVTSYVVDESIFPNGASFNLALLHKLQDLDIDFIILAGFRPRLGEGTARLYKGRALCIRRALVPAFDDVPDEDLARAATERGVLLTGVTAYMLDENGKPGEILMQQAAELISGESAGALDRRLIEQLVWPMLPEAVRKVADRLNNPQEAEDNA